MRYFVNVVAVGVFVAVFVLKSVACGETLPKEIRALGQTLL